MTPTAKNLLPVFDGLSWKSLEKRSKFPHLSIEGECKISVFLFLFLSGGLNHDVDSISDESG